MVGFVVFWILPSARSVWYSLTDFDLLNEPQFIGLDNYRELLSDDVARNSLVVTIQFVVASVVLGTVLALLTAALMQRLRLKTWVRSILLLPWLVPNVAIALIWAWLLDGQLGYLNHLLHAVGLPGVSFYNASQAMPIIIAIGIWSGLGYTALLFYAGMTQVPNEMYEAGAIDGATETRMFFRITLPLIRPVIALVVVMSAIGSFQVFDLVLIGYGGNPIPAVRTIFFYIYQQSFAFFRMGYGSAIALVLAVILGALTAIQMRAMRANRSDLS
jgi:multiple sugar transport system permease protein